MAWQPVDHLVLDAAHEGALPAEGRGHAQPSTCQPRAAVVIEPSLRLQSLENGNIHDVGRRLSAIWPAQNATWEDGDSRQKRESPPLAGFSGGPGAALPNTGLRGWGGRDRTSEWRNQNQFDYSTFSGRIWKKRSKHASAISIGWQPFPNMKAALHGGTGLPSTQTLSYCREHIGQLPRHLRWRQRNPEIMRASVRITLNP